MARIGFSPRRTIAYLYAWTLMLAGLALALRFVPYSDHKGHLHTGWALVRLRPHASESEIECKVVRDLETGEIDAVVPRSQDNHNPDIVHEHDPTSSAT
jgi:hypothetical protein